MTEKTKSGKLNCYIITSSFLDFNVTDFGYNSFMKQCKNSNLISNKQFFQHYDYDFNDRFNQGFDIDKMINLFKKYNLNKLGILLLEKMKEKEFENHKLSTVSFSLLTELLRIVPNKNSYQIYPKPFKTKKTRYNIRKLIKILKKEGYLK